MAFPQRRRTPSFSSSLLDAIYRSIDESDGLGTPTKPTTHHLDNLNSNSKSVRSPNSSGICCNNPNLKSLRRAIMDDDNWVCVKSSHGSTIAHHSSSNSSDSSSSSATFSSSEAESCGGVRRTRKPEKLGAQGNRSSIEKKRTDQALDERFSKTDDHKLNKAVRVYDELKRSKQPISPGARLASFLNSIFQSNAKKVKLCSVSTTRDVKSSSRSCFRRTRRNSEDYESNNNHNNNKNSIKNKNNNNGIKRSVRFYPVSVMVEEDCRESRDKIVRDKTPLKPQTKVSERTSIKEELKIKHHKEMTCVTSKVCLTDYKDDDHGEAEDKDDVWSYASSDLFELPVYETTDFKTNQAIARGLIL